MKESEKYIDNLNLSEEEVLKDIVEIIIEHFSPDRIILFGSRAAPTHSPESDYDICILKSGIEHKRKFSQAILHSIGRMPCSTGFNSRHTRTLRFTKK